MKLQVSTFQRDPGSRARGLQRPWPALLKSSQLSLAVGLSWYSKPVGAFSSSLLRASPRTPPGILISPSSSGYKNANLWVSLTHLTLSQFWPRVQMAPTPSSQWNTPLIPTGNAHGTTPHKAPWCWALTLSSRSHCELLLTFCEHKNWVTLIAAPLDPAQTSRISQEAFCWIIQSVRVVHEVWVMLWLQSSCHSLLWLIIFTVSFTVNFSLT